MKDELRPTPGQSLSRREVKPHVQGNVKQQIRGILQELALGGYADVTSHFKMRSAQRGFSAPEALNVLKRGKIIGTPEFCAEFCNWKFSVEGEHDDGTLVVVAAVSAGDVGQPWSHSVMLVTGYIR